LASKKLLRSGRRLGCDLALVRRPVGQHRQLGLRYGALPVVPRSGRPEFVDIYLRLGRAYKVPILLVKDLLRRNPAQYSEPLTTQRYDAIVAEAREDGFAIFEILLETPWRRVSDAESACREIFGSISDGLTFLAFHFNTPGGFEAIEPEYAHIRTEEYALFKTPQIAKWLPDYGLESVGFREIRDSLRPHWTDRSI
jgi:hypothetical protein